LLWLQEEIAALFKSLNAFNKNGAGDDEETLLELFGGGRTTNHLADGERRIANMPRVSIYGGLQPTVIKSVFPDLNDPNGKVARFRFCFPKIREDGGDFTYDINLGKRLQNVLSHLYTTVEGMGLGDVYLSPAAAKRWRNFPRWIFELQNKYEQTNPGYQTTLAKSPLYALRLALVLHHIECAVDGRDNPQEIQESTLKRAILLEVYYLNQFRKLQMHADPMGCLDSAIVNIQDFALTQLEKGKTTSARDIQQSFVYKAEKKKGNKLTSGQINGYLQKMVILKFGYFDKVGKSQIYVPYLPKEMELYRENAGAEAFPTPELESVVNTCLKTKPELQSEEQLEKPPIQVGDTVREMDNPEVTYRVLSFETPDVVKVKDLSPRNSITSIHVQRLAWVDQLIEEFDLS
jgi:hypothetical protein